MEDNSTTAICAKIDCGKLASRQRVYYDAKRLCAMHAMTEKHEINKKQASKPAIAAPSFKINKDKIYGSSFKLSGKAGEEMRRRRPSTADFRQHRSGESPYNSRGYPQEGVSPREKKILDSGDIVPSDTPGKRARERSTTTLGTNKEVSVATAPIPAATAIQRHSPEVILNELEKMHPIESFERTVKAAKYYDSTKLDSYLALLTAEDNDEMPSTADLVGTQVFGHINPQIVWPKPKPEGWLERKKAEIAIRGNRKTNFGKILTAQNLKDRADRGFEDWGVNTERYMDDPKMAALAKFDKDLEELFGVKKMIRNGYS